MLNHIGHGYNRTRLKSIFLFDLRECAHLAAQAFFHAVKGNHQAFDLYLCLLHQDWERFFNRFAGGGNVLNDDNSVAILELAAQENAYIAVILHFLAVGAVTDLLAVKRAVGDGRGHAQGNALVGRAEQHIEIVPKIFP